MAYTTPATAVAGTVLTAAFLNTYVRDNIAWCATDSPQCHVYHSTTQSISSATNKSLLYNSERFDNAAMHSTSVNTQRITVPTGGAGKYIVGANQTWASATAQDNFIELNGVDGAGSIISFVTWASTTRAGPLPVVYALAAADFVANSVLQSSGGAININNQNFYSPEFWSFWFRT